MATSLAVIGAGPGGLYAAREALNLGMSVTVFEKRAVGERIQCAEGFFDLLKLLAPPEAGVRCKVSEVIFSVKDTFSVDCRKLNIWMIDRAEWQQALALELRGQGCVIREHTTVTPELCRKLAQEYDWVIDASGVSPVSRKSKDIPKGKIAFTGQYTLRGDFSGLFGKLKAVVEPHYYGYYWIFPKEPDVANVGLGWFGMRPGTRLHMHEELKRVIRKENLQECEVVARAGGPVPVEIMEQLVFGNTLLIGDAAGLASPLHGGGIDTACISGVLAARALALGKPELYEPWVRKTLGARLELEQSLLNAWYQLKFEEINELMAAVLGNGLAKLCGLGRLWKYRGMLFQEVSALRRLLSGCVNADWPDVAIKGL